MRPLLVLEDTSRPPRRLFTALGVEWCATRWAWASAVFWLALGWAIAWADGAPGGPASVATAGAACGFLLYLTNTVHTLGHLGAARLAGTPMDAVLLTSTRDVMVYRGAKRAVAERVRVARSLGGPLANTAVGAAALALGAPSGDGMGWLRVFGIFNLCIAAWTLAPVPTMDGWIVWRWVFRRGAPSR